ncbi:ferredoxin reductase family protein [Microbacteriaceae bacterium]|nr:ferredoxin reductase family protein [Candidatus Saccharibacteria bacterium]
MKPKVHLFDGKITLAQQLLLLFWSALLVSVVFLWAIRGVTIFKTDLSGLLLSIGQLLGLLATFFALTQFMLMGRIPWIERAFGLDRLASYHKFNGYAAIVLIIIHPIFITLYHIVQDNVSYGTAYLSIFREHPYTLWALVAEILFVAVVISSIYIARKHLSFEKWYYVHLMVYLAIVLAAFHQFANGGSLAGSTTATNYWLSLYAFVALNIIIFRFGQVAYNLLRFQFRVSRVVAETPSTTSIYIKGNRLSRLRVIPGQFIFIRFLNKQFWWQEHPFTVSWVPKQNELRVTIKGVGDFTKDVASVAPGTRVAVSGPFGRFTRAVKLTDKQLLIAGGVGITPIRALMEQSAEDHFDTVVLYSNRVDTDVPLRSELDDLDRASKHMSLKYIYSEKTRTKGALLGRIDGDYIQKLVPDYRDRDIYICGPPPMTAALIDQLTKLGVDTERLHYEVFALHS